MAVGIAAVVFAELAIVWGLGMTGDHFDPQCMQPPGCSK
jgi:hypothetical protein